ncbi:MAG: hypothetical protein PHW04_12865 [Candidatus Wallbacteria bacterium]|nr:hypothetical protein [Candidatus Wallbacteria bacterium]
MKKIVSVLFVCIVFTSIVSASETAGLWSELGTCLRADLLSGLYSDQDQLVIRNVIKSAEQKSISFIYSPSLDGMIVGPARSQDYRGDFYKSRNPEFREFLLRILNILRDKYIPDHQGREFECTLNISRGAEFEVRARFDFTGEDIPAGFNISLAEFETMLLGESL